MEDDDLSGLESDAEGPTTDAQHVEDLKALALKDPEFFKYLQENDAELLDFGGEGEEADIESESESEGESDSDMEDEGEKNKSKKGKGKERVVKAVPVLTKEILRGWQKSILTVSAAGRECGRMGADK